jgi:UDPglucose 6-dehydrogenase
MRIAMIGAGYVGLTTGACLARLGHRVVCADVDRKRIERLEAGDIPLYEPGLAATIARGAKHRRLSFSADIAEAVADADAIFIAVGTPSGPDGGIDLSQVQSAARMIARPMRRDAVVAIKSTVIAGTARRLRDIIAETRGGLDFAIASNPEFLREGTAVEDFMCPDRIVIGADDARAAHVLERIYSKLIGKGVPCVTTSTTNAEMIKYAANALLALKVGFINEMADLCEAVGGDVRAVAKGIGLDRRIGGAFLAAGPGFGGSCFPKDTRALAAIGRQRQAPLHLVETLIARNEARKARMARRILGELGRTARGARVAILGISFKANTDDVRDSAALTVIPLLQEAGCEISAHDPKADAAALPAGVTWHGSPYGAARGADLVAILTVWPDDAALDLGALGDAMRGNTIFDCRDVLDTDAAAAHGLRHVALGRGRPMAHAGHGRPATVAGSAQIAASPA